MRSLRTRLFTSTLATTSLFFIGAGVVLYLLMRSSVIAEFDASMLAKAGALGASMEQEPAGIEVELEPGQMPEIKNWERASELGLQVQWETPS